MSDQPSLRLSAELYRRMIAHLRTELPREGCGLIAFAGDAAVELFPGTNTESSETRYNMDLAEVVAAFNEIDQRQWRLGAIYHSHPTTPARPSVTDLSYAFYPDALMVIVSFAVDPPDLRAFRVEEDGTTEVPVVVGDELAARFGAATAENDASSMDREGQRMVKQQKVVGVLGGMGPLATVDLYRKIIEETPATHDQEHLHVIIESNPAVPDRSEALLSGGEDPTPLLLSGVRRLAAAGADFIVVPCNTAHAFLPRLQSDIDIPLISMIDATARTIAAEQPGSVVGILATAGTIWTRLYQDAFAREGLSSIVPDEAGQARVTEAIAGVKAGRTGAEQTALVQATAAELIANGAQALIVACTELPLILMQEHVSVSLYDPTRILARAAVATALGSAVRVAKETSRR